MREPFQLLCVYQDSSSTFHQSVSLLHLSQNPTPDSDTVGVKRETTRKHELKMNSCHILPIIFNVVQLMEDNYERSIIVVPLPLSHQFLI